MYLHESFSNKPISKVLHMPREYGIVATCHICMKQKEQYIISAFVSPCTL